MERLSEGRLKNAAYAKKANPFHFENEEFILEMI